MPLMMNGKPVIVAGGNAPGVVHTINSGAGNGQASVFAPPAPVLKAPAPPPPAPIPSTFAPPPPVSTPAPVSTPHPVAPAPPEFAPQAPAPPPAPTFGPGNTLINKQIASAPSGPNSFDNQAAQYAQGAGVGDYSAQTDQARQMILDQLKTLQSAPDRLQLAQNEYNAFQQAAEPQYQTDLRGVGQKAAALGRVGAGMTTNDLTGVLGQHQNALSLERQNLTNTALENTLQDRLNISGALNNAGGLLGGQDLSLGQAKSNAALGQAGLFGNLGQNQAQREATGVAQQMQQQQYQSGLDQQNIQNQIAQQQLQQGAQNQAWQQNFAQQSLAAQIAAQQNTQYPGIQQPPPINSAQLGYNGA